MGGVFISYRRTDADSALLFYSWLRERFGAAQVFWDREDIPPGARYDDVLVERVRAAAALVALIGPDWVSRRLHEPGDWVRREIATALELGRLVVPVLMGRADVLDPGDLPADLRELPRLQAVQLSDLRVREQLIAALDRVVAPAAQPPPDAPAGRLQDVVRGQLVRLQMRAVELIRDGRADSGAEVLGVGSELVLALLELTPRDLDLDVQLGYLYGTLAQALDDAGDAAGADRNVELASHAFQRVVAAATPQQTTQVASGLNGLAGVFRRRGDFDRAIAYSRQAVRIIPEYGYAWHDLFAVLDERATAGRIDVGAMAEALQQVRATGLGAPGLSAGYLDTLEQRLGYWRETAAAHPELVG
jgi:tetratricopeptide (TPR) repeat protein